ncbi:ankyrin repeat and fibronectin type-III domain-containing protein 1 isoform X9 [Daktulosphaira vitifoliae]|uniref:ankyrin repeat and fibronectin type-III domain-containing protein 1 isoform X5 n=1 Tax=Daktulosphaira vitifoliae TaxID=58002 RepID=UPI0021A9A8CE|nr:ankyrin repeat and fibronectin type-III domain-containing protein 1 isoform X5 [Daktulosphaira vitifoliae]XP_050538091.1 ankyrin repeat and fibronectin type-III domain-containing protein 1 isoform X6 [Daktulosphaira vitifoliae]XP_050538092.1 ankyrin repeat and fibronectin type-III domain-containing protein 1 isoform X7 [Daktulosphaira vitifoliae]XP_050538094.1 ankyrin repeat and fibronectin type-III domain-containing protein 1 isoform X9 [Daktulosphaira vitifoliae]
MAEFERLIPLDDDHSPPAQHTHAGPATFSRLSLARFSQRFRRGWTVAVDNGESDKENATAAAGKRVKFDKRVYHGPVVQGSRPTCVRSILKTGDRSAPGTANTVLRDCYADDGNVPNRMRLYDVPVTSFYIAANEPLTRSVNKQHQQIKRCASVMSARKEANKYRRFGTDIGTSISSQRNSGGSGTESQSKQHRQHNQQKRDSQVHNINIHLHGLFAAVEHGQLEKAKNILTTCEVQVNSVNSDGLTPLDVAFLGNDHELVRLLLSHGATEETSMKNLEPHLLNLLSEAERRVLELRLCGNQDNLQTKTLALWERRKRGLKKMLIGFEHAKPPDKPEKIILQVTGNDSVSVSCIEADNPDSAICTKFNIEWSTSESFKSVAGTICMPATDGKVTISNLEHGKTYYFRCNAGNLKAFSEYLDPVPITVSSWWDVCQESRRCTSVMKVKMDDILDKMISIRPDLHRSSFEVGGGIDNTASTKKRKPPTFKHLFSGNTKLHKNLRRGVYLSCLLYHEDKVLVSNEDYLPVVEIDDTYPKEMLNDFHWFYKVAFAWKDLKWLKDDLEKSTNSSFSFRTKIIQAVIQMQDVLNSQNLGKVYYKPIRDSDGTTVICMVSNVSQPKNIVNLKWTPMTKILKKSSRSENLTDLLISSIQDQIMFHQTSCNRLPKGLYVGYLLMRSSVDMLHVMVPSQNPNMPACCKVRDNPHVTAEEWLWLRQGISSGSCETKCLGFMSQFKMATNRLYSLVQIPKDKRSVQRIYTSEVIEVDRDVSLIMIVPPAEVACAVGESSHSALHLQRTELVPLTVQVFEMIHFGTYRANTLLLYARLSSVVQMDTDDARYSIRQAWSSSDLEAAKLRLDTVETLETRLNAAWKHLRWLLDVMNFARERLFTSQMSNTNYSKSASNSQLEMKSVKSNSLLQLPDTKLVKSRGSWPGPGLNSMRTLESVCPEISRSDQYLSPSPHDRGFILTSKQSCSSETSGDSKDDPDYIEEQVSDKSDHSFKTPLDSSIKELPTVVKVDSEEYVTPTLKSEGLVPVPAPGIIEVHAAYDTGLSHPASLTLHISPTTSAREVVQLFLQQLNMSVLVKGKTGPIYPSTEFANFCLVSVTGARERCLRDDFKPLQLTEPWRNGRMYIRHKQDVLAALELHSSIPTKH